MWEGRGQGVCLPQGGGEQWGWEIMNWPGRSLHICRTVSLHLKSRHYQTSGPHMKLSSSSKDILLEDHHLEGGLERLGDLLG